jgi:6-phosphogluconolactonase
MYPVQVDGRLGAASDIVQHYGSSVDPERQTAPYAHSVNIDPDNRYALVADLGMDKVMVYRLDLEQGKLVPNDPPFASLHAGAGPRHLAFHPNRKYVYVINELDSTMTAFSYLAEAGELSEIQTLSTLPEGYPGEQSSCADIHVAPSGKFVYGSNRGHDSIAIFAVDLATGKLSLVGHESTQGKTPRNFAIDPSGTFLLAANQDSSTVVSFRIDQQTGELHPTGDVAQIPTPVCLKFAR